MYVCIYLHVPRCSHITCVCTLNTVWALPNYHLVTLYHPLLFLTFDGEVCCHILIMSSHAPGEGGKNAPVQITEGPSMVARFARSRVVITVLTSTPISAATSVIDALFAP